MYRYLDVPEEVYEELMSADSRQAYFNEYIRDPTNTAGRDDQISAHHLRPAKPRSRGFWEK